MATPSIRSLYVVGNSYSATTQGTAMKAWPGMLSYYGLGFPFVQANSVAWPGCQLVSKPNHPGLMDQLARIPAGSKAGALLAIWLFPDLSVPLQPRQFIPLYTSGMDRAYSQGFRMVFMPNLPDLTKTPLYKKTYNRIQLKTFQNGFLTFNAQYNTMVNSFSNRYRTTRFGTCDVWSRWDGTGTVPDGLHPTPATHQLFAQWFWNSIWNW
jgi:GDSL-like Lipase/Acylhydrolase